MTTLRGMTWSHPRGYDPLVACARLWWERTGVEVEWDRRSLQDFESFPVLELARRYDLIVIDHPHIGQVTREACLLPLDAPDRTADLATLAAQSVGPSLESYRYDGQLWALPIDAATQVQAWRRDRLAKPASRWDDVLALAREGRVLCPLRPPHSLMVFCTLAANLGQPCAAGGRFVDPGFGRDVYARIRALAGHLDPACLTLDPIAVYERMAEPDSPIACAPLIYGYVSYGIAGFRGARIAFADIPAAGEHGPVGSTLGGTGIAVSARTQHAAATRDFAFWVASAEVQRGAYADAGGQPGNAVAWQDAAIDARAGGFYQDTWATLRGAWVRPRHDGYMPFQDRAAVRINDALRAGEDGARLVDDLNRFYADSQNRAGQGEQE